MHIGLPLNPVSVQTHIEVLLVLLLEVVVLGGLLRDSQQLDAVHVSNCILDVLIRKQEELISGKGLRLLLLECISGFEFLPEDVFEFLDLIIVLDEFVHPCFFLGKAVSFLI
jgi:hypothetical protein